jgi:hypothetical protein
VAGPASGEADWHRNTAQNAAMCYISLVMCLNYKNCSGKTWLAVWLAACLSLDAERATAQAQPVSAPVAGRSSERITLDRLSATRDRPLFSPSRRPPTITETAPPPPPPLPPVASLAPVEPPNVRFFGTFESNDQLGASIQSGPNEKTIIVRYGTYIEGWRVTEISRHRLVLSLDDRTAVFTLFNSKASGSPGAPLLPGEPRRLDAEGHELTSGPNSRRQPP